MNSNALKLRLRKFIKQENLSLQEFMAMIGKARNYFSTTANISSGVLQDIKKKFPDLNMEWLLTGEGEMLKPSAVDSTVMDSHEMRQAISYQKGVPYYDVDFILGFDIASPPWSDNPEYLIDIPRYNRATLWCNASGDSMDPEISNGDIVALQRIEDFSFLTFDSIYAIVTTNDMRTVKRIGRGKTQDSYRLIPTNKEYEEQELPKSMILHVYKVVGCIKHF